jgi:hypothetical protein
MVAAFVWAPSADAACPITGCVGGDPTLQRTLTVTVDGSGTVSNHGVEICNASTSPCVRRYAIDDSVSLTAAGSDGETFTSWGGACSGSGACDPDMNVNRDVTAHFADVTPPSPPSITKPTENAPPTVGSSVSVWFASTDATTASYRCRVDSSSLGMPCTNPWGTGALATGTHTVYVWALDSAGNVSERASRSFKVVNPPQTTIGGTPAEGALAGPRDTALTVSSPTGTSYICKLDGVDVGCAAVNSMDLADGPHTFTASAGISPFNDGTYYYDTSPAVRHWTVDAIAPDTEISSGPGSTIVVPAGGAGSASFAFAGTDPDPGTVAGYECRLDAGAWSACDSPVSETGLAVGSHTFQVRALDEVGNADGQPALRNFAVTAATPPPDTGDGGAACAAAKGKLKAAKVKVKKARAKLKRAKRHGSGHAVAKDKRALKRAKARMKRARKAVKAAC